MKKPKPPNSIEEVREYIRKERLNVDADLFWRYYDASGWHDKDGKPVRNWKQRLITWHGRAKRTAESRAKKGEIERYKQRIRDHYEEYLNGKSTQALYDLKRDGGNVSNLAGWLIDEILEKRKGE